MSKIAAAYARVSLEEQTENFSLDSQLRAIRKFAAEKGYAVPKEFTFVDEGCLGGELDRPQLVRLREAVRSGVVQAVISYDPDRLARDLKILMLVEDECTVRGVAVEYVTVPSDPTPEGRMLRQIRAVFSDYEKLKLKERTSRGRREKAEQGYVVGGRIPFGYHYLGKAQGKRGELVVNPEQAEAVRRIFDMCEKGSTLLEIARMLNADGVVPQMAPRWTKTMVAAVLRNTVYHGEMNFNRRMRSEPQSRRKPPVPGQSKKTSKRDRPASEWITIRVPAIVDRDQFERVRKQIERTGSLNVGRPSRESLLRGLIKCSACGRACTRYGGGRNKPRYQCSNIDRVSYERNCSQRSILADTIEAAVWAKVEAACTDERALRAWITEHERRASSGPNPAKERERLEREIFRLRQRERRTVQAMLDVELADSSATFRAELKATQIKIREMESRLAAIRTEQKPNSRFDPLALRRWFKRAVESGEPRRSILTKLVREIRFGNGEIEIDFVFPAIILPEKGGVSGPPSPLNRFDHIYARSKNLVRRWSRRRERYCPVGRVLRRSNGSPNSSRSGCDCVLGAAPGALDLFLWLAYRSFTAKTPQSIPLFGPFGLAAQLGCVEYSRPRRFIAKLREWLQLIHLIRPGWSVSLDRRSNRLILAMATVA